MVIALEWLSRRIMTDYQLPAATGFAAELKSPITKPDLEGPSCPISALQSKFNHALGRWNPPRFRQLPNVPGVPQDIF